MQYFFLTGLIHYSTKITLFRLSQQHCQKLKVGHFLWADVSDFMPQKVSIHMPPKVNEFSHARPNREISKCYRATWHVTGLLSNWTTSYLQVWHRISCSAWGELTVGAALFLTEILVENWEEVEQKSVERRQMKRDSIWDPCGRRSGSWLRTKCCFSATLKPNVFRMEASSTSLRSDNVYSYYLFQLYVSLPSL